MRSARLPWLAFRASPCGVASSRWTPTRFVPHRRGIASSAAESFVSAWSNRHWIEKAEDHPPAPKTVAELYEVHLAMQQHPLAESSLGGLGGYKLGAKGAEGLPCISAPLFRKFLVDAPGSDLSVSAVQMHQLEAEFGILMEADLPPRAKPYDSEEVLEAVGFFVLCIEACGRRSSEELWAAQKGLGKYSDLLNAGGIVMGPRLLVAGAQAEALSSAYTSISVNGVVKAEGSGANCPEGGPLQALTWLANHLSGRGLGLKRGQFVATGQTCMTRDFQPGDTVLASFSHLGVVTMEVQA